MLVTDCFNLKYISNLVLDAEIRYLPWDNIRIPMKINLILMRISHTRNTAGTLATPPLRMFTTWFGVAAAASFCFLRLITINQKRSSY